MTSASCCASLAAPEAVCRLTWGVGGGWGIDLLGDRPPPAQRFVCPVWKAPDCQLWLPGGVREPGF